MAAKGSGKIPIWATMLTLLGVIILCSLATWQVKRLSWKNDLLTKLQHAQENIEVQTLSSYQDIITQEQHFPVRVQGKFLTDKEIQIRPRTYDGQVGYHQFIPFSLREGGIILVNRGWIADNDTRNAPENTLTLKGILRAPEKPNIFIPPNTPSENNWFSININEIKQHHNIENLAPLMLYSVSEGHDKRAPKTAALHRTPPNNHLGYALFWFSMALVLLAIYCARFIYRRP